MAEMEPEAMLDRRSMMFSALALAGTVAATPIMPQAKTPVRSRGQEGLRARANRKGLLCGTAISHEIFTQDRRVRADMLEDCNIIVPENELKWSRLQRAPNGPLDYRKAEALYRYSADHGIKVRGTCLHWWNAQPAWAKTYIPTLSPGQAGDYLQNYIHKVVSDWRGRLVHWDVVNEPISGRGKLIDTLFAPKLGDRYIDLCFEAAQDADPKTLLCYNINYVEQESNYEHQMRVQVLKQIETLVKRGVPVQCLGIQSHITTMSRFSPPAYRAFLDRISDMGLKLLVTEFDVSDRGTIGDKKARDAATAALGKDFLDLMFDYRNMLGLLTWGPTDKYHWLRKMSDRQRRDGDALRPAPLDEKFQRKPLWHAIAAALDGAPAR